ncbi:hypothetical protein [Desulfovibrio sp. TomC]|uniref:hypothetical protein n=1 Tax=Desulfovibrio sp. TomC TaxID=1562888 RepID=UPI000574E3BF|nr:hypothetical protein [Desulfovibrio sp. TomC]KHK00128.1 hypothetical protein NY78_4458 [Desulfovibrio sp. TomC]
MNSKILCVSGANTPLLKNIMDIFAHSGVALDNSMKTPPFLSMEGWHAQCLYNKTEDKIDLTKQFNPDASWRRLASEIFLENTKSSVWGWCSSESLFFLDFWERYQENIYFVLIETSPRDLLFFIHSANKTCNNIESLVEELLVANETIRRFCTAHKDRCLTVDLVESLENPSALLDACRMKFGIHLQDNISKYQFPKQDKDPLASFLGHKLFAEKTKSLEIFQKNSFKMTRRKPHRDDRQSSDLIQEIILAVDSYFELKSNVDTAKQRLESAIEENASLNKEIVLLRNEQKIHKKDSYLLSQSYNMQLTLADQSNSVIKRLVGENKKLMHGISSFKGMLFDQIQAKIKGIAPFFHIINAQQNQILFLSETYKSAEKKFKKLQERWSRVFCADRYYCDFDTIDMETSFDDNKNLILIRWKITSFFGANRELDRLEFETIILHNGVAFVFKRDSSGQSPLFRWPIAAGNLDKITIFLLRDPILQLFYNDILAEFSTSDIDFLHALSRIAALTLQKSCFLDDNHPGLVSLSKGFDFLLNSLKNYSRDLRFDRITLKNVQINHDYEHLWIELDNVSFEEKRSPKFEFRISCAEIDSAGFGHHFKLEFPKSSASDFFDNWFGESVDDFGDKLEIRFAMPNSLDMKVWSKLSCFDQRFVSKLIEHLPYFFVVLKREGVNAKRPWANWENLVDNIMKINRSASRTR